MLKFCPMCNVATIKEGGCNVIHCPQSNCKCKWCWSCGLVLIRNFGKIKSNRENTCNC